MQMLSLPQTILSYVSQFPRLLQKLQLTCKHFHQAKPLIHQLFVRHNRLKTSCYQQSLFINSRDIAKLQLPEFQITNGLFVYCWTPEQNDLTFRKIAPKIFKCSIKFLALSGQNLFIQELASVTQFVENLWLSYNFISDADNGSATLNEIMKHVPNGSHF